MQMHTTGQIAATLGVRSGVIRRLIRKIGIEPVGWAGRIPVYDTRSVRRIEDELGREAQAALMLISIRRLIARRKAHLAGEDTTIGQMDRYMQMANNN